MAQASPYLTCGHCGCEFLATDKQIYNARTGKGKQYCSRICQSAGMSQLLKRPRGIRTPRYEGICQTCGESFVSRYPERLFCGMKCYTSSERFREMVRVNAPKALAAGVLKRTGKLPLPKVEVTCVNCGTKRIMRGSLAVGRRYCNSRCYRQYMAGRFDRWLASPQSIALPQGYDEFLSQVELPCLVEGCDWVGLHLGNHVNFTHGIPVEEFKRAAGFNKGTGLVTPAVSEAIAARPHLHDAGWHAHVWSAHHPQVTPLIRGYKSLEGAEHHAKAIALKGEGPNLPLRVCIGCGKEYEPGPRGYCSKYCSVACRSEWYYRNRKAIRFWLRCSLCLKDFEASLDQQHRFEGGGKVFCSTHCRQVHNSRVWRQRPPGDKPS